MKTIGVIGLIIGIIGAGIGIYCQIEVVPNYENFANKLDLTEMERMLLWGYADQKFLLGSLALFTGPLAILLGVISGIKKHKIGWIAVAIGLISLLLGLMQSTHAFD